MIGAASRTDFPLRKVIRLRRSFRANVPTAFDSWQGMMLLENVGVFRSHCR